MRDNKGRFIKGATSWARGIKIDREKYPNFGHMKPHTEEAKLKMSKSKKGKHYSVATEFKEKEGELSYIGLHEWVYRKLGMAKKCVNGHTAKIYYWGNISGEYKKDINDWHELCPSCNSTDGVKVHPRFKRK